MKFEDTGATTSTTYRTTGWIIHRERQPGRDAYNRGKVGVLLENDFVKIGSEPIGGGRVRTTFEVHVDKVNIALRNAGLSEIQEEEVIYLDSVFHVFKGGEKYSGPHYTYSKISNAAPWGSQTMKDLENYYNIPVPFESSLHPVYKEIRVNGQTISKEKVTELKSGKPYKMTLDKTFNHQGMETSLKSSHLYDELGKGDIKFKVDAPNPSVSERNITVPIGGIVVVADYGFDPKFKVEHIDLDNGSILEEYERVTQAGKTETESAKTFAGKSYQYSEISNDGGKTWKDRSDKATRNVVVNNSTVVRFFYSSGTDILALLNLTANPNAIDEGKKASVEFTLDSSASKASNPIVKYEFWLRDEDTDEFKETPDFTVTNPIRKISKSNVEPDTTWYGKVKITDSKGNTSEATDEVYIEEIKPDFVPEPEVDVDARLRLNVIRNSPRILDFREDEWSDGQHEYYLDLLVEEGSTSEPVDFTLDGSESSSTNGIGNYHFSDGAISSPIYEGSSSNTGIFRQNFDPRDAKNPDTSWADTSKYIGWRCLTVQLHRQQILS